MQGGRFIVLFKSGKHRLSPRFHLFFMLISHGTKEQDSFRIIRHGQRDGRTLLTSSRRCQN